MNDFSCLNFAFNSKILDLVKQKRFYPYEYVSGFKKFKERLSCKEKFSSLLTSNIISDTEFEYVIKVWGRFEMKTMKDYHHLYLKCNELLLVDFS